MKKLICMVLISSIALSITACGGKKKEEAKSAVVEQKQIAEAAVALSNEPEEPEIVEYTCLPEMYEAELEDGLIQIEDILIDTKKSQTLGDIRALFPEPRFSLIVERANKKTAPYTEDAIVSKGEGVRLNVMKDNAKVCSFTFYNGDQSSDFVPLDNCSYYEFYLRYETVPDYPIWIAKGISPSELTYNDIDDYLNGQEYEKHNARSYWLDLDPVDFVLFQNDHVLQTFLHYDFVIDDTNGSVGMFTLHHAKSQ